MYKQRRIKILSILALVVAITGMTLGFAAFSNTLTISSGAIITPNSQDFKIVVYGLNNKNLYKELENNIDLFLSLGKDKDFWLSDTLGYAYEEGATAEVASIDNKTHTISNIKAHFQSQEGGIYYYFVIRNDGKYDAYLDFSNLFFDVEKYVYYLGNDLSAICTPGEGADEFLVEEACKGIYAVVAIVDDSITVKSTAEPYYKIPAGSEEMLIFIISYDGPYADGPFDVEFEDFQLKFSTVG